MSEYIINMFHNNIMEKYKLIFFINRLFSISPFLFNTKLNKITISYTLNLYAYTSILSLQILSIISYLHLILNYKSFSYGDNSNNTANFTFILGQFILILPSLIISVEFLYKKCLQIKLIKLLTFIYIELMANFSISLKYKYLLTYFKLIIGCVFYFIICLPFYLVHDNIFVIIHEILIFIIQSFISMLTIILHSILLSILKYYFFLINNIIKMPINRNRKDLVKILNIYSLLLNCIQLTNKLFGISILTLLGCDLGLTVCSYYFNYFTIKDSIVYKNSNLLTNNYLISCILLSIPYKAFTITLSINSKMTTEEVR